MTNFFQRVGAALRGNPLDNPAVPLSSAAAWMYDIFGGAPSSAGVNVNEQTAMQYTSVYACINVLASAFSSLPCELLERKGKSKQAAYKSDLYYLLATEPNPEMSSVSFWGAMMACAALLGNGYARIQWENPKTRNTPVALWPIHPRYVTPRRNAVTGDLEYLVSVNGREEVVSPKYMLHVPALTMDGYVGLDPIRAARQSIGTGIAAGKHIGAFFGRGSRPSGILKRVQQAVMPGTLGTQKAPEDSDKVRESWERANGGDSQGRTAVLPAGWDWQAISITPEQAQLLQVLGFTRTEIAGLWQIPPHMIGDTSRLSNGNHESIALEFVTFTLRPWLVRFEMEIQRKLLPKKGRNAGLYTVRFDTTEMKRGDFASQLASFSMGRQWGVYTADEVREKLGENPVGGKAGNQLLVPLNMVPADKLTEPDPAGEVNVDENGNPIEDPDDVPAGNGGQNQRKLLERMADAYRPLFRDGVGRLQKRSVRDTAAVQQVFGALLVSISEESVRQARSMFRLPAEVDLGTEKLLRDLVKQLEKRSASWTATTVEADVDRELRFCVRTIALHIYREAGSTIAQAA